MSLLHDNDIKSLLRKYSVKPRKEMGQSFLNSQIIARQIVTSAEISQSDRILEIGGGLGILTNILAGVADSVTVIELEMGVVNALKDIFSESENVKIIHGDALTVDLPKFDKIVANLPYSISSEITFRLLKEAKFELGILMYQKEFSRRLLSSPGSSEYSRLSIDFQYLGKATHLMDVKARNFYPVPSVDSSVLKVIKRDTGPMAKNSEIFFWMVHGLYSYPNKQLRKAMKIWFKNLGRPNLADGLFSRLDDVNKTDRLRTLSLETLVRLSDVIQKLVESGDLPGPRGDSI